MDSPIAEGHELVLLVLGGKAKLEARGPHTQVEEGPVRMGHESSLAPRRIGDVVSRMTDRAGHGRVQNVHDG